MSITMCKSVLIDSTNIDEWSEKIIEDLQNSKVVGIDTETHNENAHEGVKEFRKNDAMKAVDYRGIDITGVSIYPDVGSDEPIAYYFNLGHADEKNRLKWVEVKAILDAKPEKISWIAHNAVYELTVLKSTYDYDLNNIICTLQQAVTAFGPDEYDKQEWQKLNFGEMQKLFMDINKAFHDYEPSSGRDKMQPHQSELVSKVLTKSSTSTFSYNGVVKSISYSYGLKKLVNKFFDYQMGTFKDTLQGKKHMGLLTGEEVREYGAEDAYWAVKLFYELYTYMVKNCPEAINTFFTQENPMVKVFADIRLEGMRINSKNVEERRKLERHNYAEVIRELKLTMQKLLPFPEEPNERLMKFDKWYVKGYEKYRTRLENWITSANYEDDFKQVCQISSPVSNAWAGKKVSDLSLGHYYQSRLMMYDLTRSTPIIYKGKVQSDGEARGELRDRFKKRIENYKKEGDLEQVAYLKTCDKVLKLMGKLANIEQRMKLYLNPYTMLTDPETKRMYPEVSSMLATRRMACSNPNAMQLAKRGESTYVRGFFLADSEDELLVSADWSQIELVLVGEFSGDPEFKKAYGQIPYEDLHTGATVDVMNVLLEGVLTVDMLNNLSKMETSAIPSLLLTKPNGDVLAPYEAKKYWRTEVGKGSNFNYWYSGALATVGEKLGMTSDQMWKATEAYRNRFAVAEAWRSGLIEQAKWDGYVMLPDGLRRTIWAVTHEWATITKQMFKSWPNSPGLGKFGDILMRAVRTRAGNQLVNAKIQGSCATLAKRSILAINKEFKEKGIRGRFKMPIHDELVFSIHKEDIIEGIKIIRKGMTTHPDIIKNLVIDCTVSIGKTFEPWSKDNAPYGQFELDEAPEFLGLTKDSRLNDEEVQKVIDYMFEEK